MGCNECNDCNEATDPCLEECGCTVEITSLSCVRHDGNDFPCIEVIKGDTLEDIISKINDRLCDIQSGIDGEDGAAGQGIDHVIYVPDSVGDTAGQTGQLDTYKVWGDVAETIGMGTFTIYNGTNGTGVDHTSFTSTSGTVLTAGASGQTDTYTLWADAAETVSLGTYIVYNGADGADAYDSGWISIPDYSAINNFGLAAYTIGWQHPKIRVVGKVVFLEGYLMIPLSSTDTGTTLVDDVSTYPSTQKTEVTPYSGVGGGYAATGISTLKTVNPILPSALTPSEKHVVSTFEITYRPLTNAKSTISTALSTIFKNTYLNTDGTFELHTMAESEGEAPYTLGIIANSPLHMLISRVSSGDNMVSYSTYKTSYTASVDNRVSPELVYQYAADFDGNLPDNLGGFRAKLTTSYPLGENITLNEIATAIALL